MSKAFSFSTIGPKPDFSFGPTRTPVIPAPAPPAPATALNSDNGGTTVALGTCISLPNGYDEKGNPQYVALNAFCTPLFPNEKQGSR
jgi:hypothetical protein